jgi:hypothetical protein
MFEPDCLKSWNITVKSLTFPTLYVYLATPVGKLYHFVVQVQVPIVQVSYQCNQYDECSRSFFKKILEINIMVENYLRLDSTVVEVKLGHYKWVY